MSTLRVGKLSRPLASVTALLSTLVDTAVATTVTPGLTAPLGSVTTPEIEPVMAAHATRVPRNTTATTPPTNTKESIHGT